MNPCVKDCPERNATCHATCGKYKDWRANKDLENSKIREENAIRQALYEHNRERNRKMKSLKNKPRRTR